MQHKVFFIALIFTVAMTLPAEAAAAIGGLVVSALGFVGLGGLVAGVSAATVGAFVIAGAGFAISALSKSRTGQHSNANPGDIKNTTAGSESDGRHAFGRVRLGGKVVFGNTSGYDIYRLIICCFGPLDSVEEYFYGGLEIVVDVDGKVSSPPWATASTQNLYIKTKIGDGTETAWSELTSTFPTLWTSDHRARGLVQILLHAVNPGTGDSRFLTLFQGGIKNTEVVARIGDFYDPRPDASAWTMNAVLVCLHYLRQLPGMSDSQIDFDDIKTIANQADTSVTVIGGTAPRAQLSGGWEGPLTADILNDMLESAGLELIETDAGLNTFRFIEDDPDSEITLYNNQIIDRVFQAGPEGAKRPNICRLKYFSPERGYDLAEIDLTGAPWAKVQGEIDKYGEQELLISLVFCSDASQAQRIARRIFHMERADFGMIKTTMAGLATWGMKTITIEIPDVGVDGASLFVKCRKGTVRTNDADGTCEIPVKIIPDELTTAWNSATMEVAAPPQLVNIEFESELATPAAPSLILVQYPDNSYETRIKFTSVSGAATAEGNYRKYTGGNPESWLAMTEYLGDSGAWYAYSPDNTLGRKVDARCRFFNANGEASHLSSNTAIESMVVNNLEPTAPTVVETEDSPNDQVTLDATAPSHNTVKMVFEENYNDTGWSTHTTLSDVRPDIERSVTITVGSPEIGLSTLQWRVSAVASDGTRSAYTSGSMEIDGGSP